MNQYQPLIQILLLHPLLPLCLIRMDMMRSFQVKEINIKIMKRTPFYPPPSTMDPPPLMTLNNKRRLITTTHHPPHHLFNPTNPIRTISKILSDLSNKPQVIFDAIFISINYS